MPQMIAEYTLDTFPRDRWPNFSYNELACRFTGLLKLNPVSMDRLQRVRAALGTPLVVTSAYRHATHPDEVAKVAPGTHNLGMAFDVQVWGREAFMLIGAAQAAGFTGIGIAQRHGNKRQRFIHLDDALADLSQGRPRPFVWSY